MKIKAILFAIAVSAVTAFGQGQVSILNSTLNTPIYLSEGVLLPAGGNAYSFQLFYGTSPDNLNLSTPVFFNHDTQAGRISASANSIVLEIANVPAYFQLRAWNTSAGSFEAAQNGGVWFETAVITATPSISPSPATPLFGPGLGTQFQGFTMVPEPSTFALGALGIGALLMVRRRKA